MQDAPDSFRYFPWRSIAVGLAVYLALQITCIGLATFGGSSEAREALVVDVILREGNWILPLRNGQIPSKPLLFHWIAALISAALGGVTEFSVRLTSQFAAVVCLLFVALAAFRIATLRKTFQGEAHPSRAALLSAGILSLTYGFYQMSCQAMVDMTFCACVWGALSSVVLGVQRGATLKGTSRIGAAARGFFWFFCSLAALARGPLGFVLPVLLVGIAGWCLVGVRQTIVEFLRPTLGWLAFLLPVSWYVGAYHYGGTAFLERQIFFENLRRFSGGEFVNSEAWWFYPPSILRTTFPWGVVLLVVLFAQVRSRLTLSYSKERGISRWIPTILLCAGVLLFSLSSGKRHSYMLPLLPFVALQLGLELSSLLEQGGARARQRLTRMGRGLEVSLLSCVLILMIGLSLSAATGIISSAIFKEAFAAASEVISRLGTIILVSALIVLGSLRRTLRSVCASVWFLMIVCMSAVVSAGAVVKSHWKGFDVISSTWLATAMTGDQLAVFKGPFDEYFDPLLFYVRRPVRLIYPETVGSECEAHTVYAARRSWLDAHEGLFPAPIVRIVTVRERLQALRAHDDKELVFFRCGTYSGISGDNPPLLQDASLLSRPESRSVSNPG